MVDIDKFKVLVATDLAGRGLDVEGIKMVVNYDCPKSIETYVHRAGRTGRAGRQGTAVTLLTTGDEHIFYDLVTYLKNNDQSVPPELENHPLASVRRRPNAEGNQDQQPGSTDTQNGQPPPPTRFEGGLVQAGGFY